MRKVKIPKHVASRWSKVFVKAYVAYSAVGDKRGDRSSLERDARHYAKSLCNPRLDPGATAINFLNGNIRVEDSVGDILERLSHLCTTHKPVTRTQLKKQRK